MRARKRFGQHFLEPPWVAKVLAAIAPRVAAERYGLDADVVFHIASAGVGHADWLMEGRVGQHPCFDRLVFELAGPAAGARVRYVDRLPVVPGRTVQPSGGARLMIRIPTTLPPASATDGSVQSTLGPVNSGPLFDVRGFRTFRDVRWARIDANGAVIGLGVRARLPFRVFVLDGPGERSRVVVDVAHRW